MVTLVKNTPVSLHKNGIGSRTIGLGAGIDYSRVKVVASIDFDDDDYFDTEYYVSSRNVRRSARARRQES